MDPLDTLAVRFHLGGQFDFDGHDLHYIGGRVEMPHIERDKLSLPELRGHLGDHVVLTPEHNVDFHWLFPGSELSNGLRKISDDKTCIFMSECIIDGGVAKLYVEIYNNVGGDVYMWSCDEATKHQTTNDIEKLLFTVHQSREEMLTTAMNLKIMNQVKKKRMKLIVIQKMKVI
jgi:hypothetical protein